MGIERVLKVNGGEVHVDQERGVDTGNKHLER